MTHRALLVEVWGPAYADDTQSLRTHIANLRRKIEPAGGGPRYIRTDPGVGYRLADLSARSEHAGRTALTLGALGVVFGDIGTSPLYAVQTVFVAYRRRGRSPIDTGRRLRRRSR